MASMSEVAKAKLNTIMGRPSSASLNVKEEFLAPMPDFDSGALKKDALTGKPSVVSMERQVDMARNGVLLAQKKSLPDFQFSIGYKDRKNTGGDSEPDSVEPDPMGAKNVQSAVSGMSSQTNGWKVELMVMLPLWGGLNKAEVKAAEAGVEVARASLDGMKSMTDLDLQMALTEAQSAWRQIGLYENVVIPQAEQTYQAGVVSYTNGRSDFMAVLDSFNVLCNARLDHYKARVNYEKAIAELEKAAGKPLLPLQIGHNE
jgi:outer membrane protein TolC